MAKVLKGIAIGALVGFASVFLSPSLGAYFLGVTAKVGLVGITNAVLATVVGGAIVGGVAGAASSFVRAPSLDLNDVLGRLNISANSQEVFKIVVGETAFATDVVYAENHGVDNEYRSMVLSAAGHLVTEFGSLYVNDELISFSGDAATGAWADTLWRQTALGTETDVAFPDIDAGDNFDWPTTAEGLGVAKYRLRFKLGQKKTNNGIPSRITQIGKGLPVYDPRLDDTVGGSGDHRADDQSTWEYNDGSDDIGKNLVLVAVTYLLGWKLDGQQAWGVFADPDDIDYDQLIAAANVAQETVDSKWRYEIGGLFTADNDHDKFFRQLEGAVGLKVRIVGGKYFIWVPDDDLSSPFSSISGDEFVKDAGVEHDPAGEIGDLKNTYYGQYVSPDDLYQLVPYPTVEEAAAITEDGGLRVKEHNFAIIQHVSIAERVARYLIRRSRFTASWKFATGPSGMRFRPFDVTTLNCLETGDSDQLVRIINMDFSLSGVVYFECIEEDTSIYDTSTALGTPVTQNDPDDVDPSLAIDVTNYQVITQTLSGSDGTARDALLAAWDDPGSFVRETEVQFKKTTDLVWQSVAPSRVGFLSALFEVQPDTLYDVRARHITIYGVLGDWEATTQTSGTNEVSYNTANVGALASGTVTTATINFNGRNDRIATALTDPTTDSGGDAVDHTVNVDGSVNISFEWSWGGDEEDIDGFIVFERSHPSSGTSYSFGTTIAEENNYFLPADRRAFILTGVAADHYYTLGVQAYRIVDPDIDASGLLVSNLVKPGGSGEDPYNPENSVEYSGFITGTIEEEANFTVVHTQGGQVYNYLTDPSFEISNSRGFNIDDYDSGDIHAVVPGTFATFEQHWYAGDGDTMTGITFDNDANSAYVEIDADAMVDSAVFFQSRPVLHAGANRSVMTLTFELIEVSGSGLLEIQPELVFSDPVNGNQQEEKQMFWQPGGLQDHIDAGDWTTSWATYKFEADYTSTGEPTQGLEYVSIRFNVALTSGDIVLRIRNCRLYPQPE